MVGVFGRGDFLGDGWEEMFGFGLIVEIGAGLGVGFVAVFSAVLGAAGFVPFVCPFVVFPAAFFSSTFAFTFGTSFADVLLPASSNVLFGSVTGGVSMAISGIVSEIAALFFLAFISVAMLCFRSAVSLGCDSSSMLKLVLRFAILGSPEVSLLSPRPI